MYSTKVIWETIEYGARKLDVEHYPSNHKHSK